MIPVIATSQTCFCSHRQLGGMQVAQRCYFEVNPSGRWIW